MGSATQECSPQCRVRTPFGTATQIPVQVFVDKILPPLHTAIDFDKLVDLSLQNPGGRSLLPITKNRRLWGYGSKKPSEVKGPRASTFRSLLVCAGRIARAVQGLDQTLVFKNNDRSQWDLRKRDEDSLPDAYLLVSSLDLPGSQHAMDWTSIAIPAVYSKFSTEQTSKDNGVKVLRCMAQCMDRDARRRFVYGFAVEDSTMTLWYCNRAQINCSEPFDFVKDWRTLFRFLLSVMFAEREQLGFDPTMTLSTQDDDSVQYDILVRSDTGETQVFRTLELLSELGAEQMLGRATRVWKAVKIENGVETGDRVVLKDCWVDHYREREGHINARIRASAISEHQRRVLEKSLLTVLIHGDVFVSEAHDCTASHLRRNTCTQDATTTVNSGNGSSYVPDTLRHHEVHYRIVFKEIGQPLREATSLKTVFKALKDVTNGLLAMYQCGWVHGDLSTGNILLYEDWAKIADLEYAVQKDERKRHDKTGTEHFAAVEVTQQTYLFRPQTWEEEDESVPGSNTDQPLSPCLPPTKNSSDVVNSGASSVTATNAHTQITEPIFLYNPLHDLESLWWIALYFVITREVVDEDVEDSPERITAQREMASDFFWTGAGRLSVFKFFDYLPSMLGYVHPSVYHIAVSLEAARRYLIKTYHKAERKIEENSFQTAGELHKIWDEMFSELANSLTANDVQVRLSEDDE